MTKEELIVEEQKTAILREASRGCHTIAETIWRCRAALQAFEAEATRRQE
jgi:hypothetical protein